jgi:hypothetical protein
MNRRDAKAQRKEFMSFRTLVPFSLRLCASAVIITLVAPAQAWATAYTGSVTGNWNASATWGGSGVPGQGDTCTINTAITVTVPSGYSAAVGTSGASGTVACTVNGTGALVIASGGSLTLYGELDLQKGATLDIYGTLTFAPPSGSTYKVLWLSTGTPDGYLNICSDSACDGNGTPASVTTTQGGGGNGWFDANTNYSPIMTINKAVFNYIGNSSNMAIQWTHGYTNRNCNISNTLFNNSGEVNCSYVSGYSGGIQMIWNAIDFRNSLASTVLLYKNPQAIGTDTRTITNVTVYGSSSAVLTISLQASSTTVGNNSNGTPGIVCYDCQISTSGFSNSISSYGAIIADASALSGQPLWTIGGLANETFQNSIIYTYFDNPHDFNESGSGGLTTNYYTNSICDGGGYPTDTGGNYVIGGSTALTVSKNILLNTCGTLMTANTSGAAFMLLNNTLYQIFAAAIGETTGAAGQLVGMRNNLTVNQQTGDSCCLYKVGLIAQETDFVRQTSSNLTGWDYNYYWSLAAQSEPNTNLPDPNKAGNPGQYGPPTRKITSSTATSGTTTTVLYCSSCNFTGQSIPVQAGDFAFNVTRSNAMAQVSTVNSSTELTLASAIANQTSGDSFFVGQSYSSNAGDTYGTTWGTHDKYLNPGFRDTTRTMATWDTFLGGPGTMTDVARKMVTINGYDYQGNSVTPTTTFTVANALAYIRLGFTPSNMKMYHAGSSTDGNPSIGALDPVPMRRRAVSQ